MELPEDGKPGDELTWEWLNKLSSACRRALSVTVDASSGLEMQDAPYGKTLRLAKRGQVIIVLTTSDITKATGATYGSGTATIQVDTGTALASGSATLTVYNYHTDKKVLNGNRCGVYFALGKWWVFDPAACAALA